MQSSLRKISFLLIGFGLVFLVACGGSGAPMANVEGSWAGTWRSSRGQGSTLIASFAQSDTSITGTVRVNGSPCLSTGTLSGTASNRGVTFGAVSGSHGISFRGRVSGNRMTGSYSVSSGFCAGDTGSFELERQ